jgi:anti-anti-sigma factor
MKIDYDDRKGLTMVPTGLFDYTAGQECLRKAEPYIKDVGAMPITVDFSETTFMDSSGIGALIALMRALPDGAPPIKLTHPSTSVQKLLEICHLHRLFVIVPRLSDE